ncbi:T9SS type A sorting domain-containing protein [Flavobacterium buctense]|uniref:T9SS type A sorting domain-containing protein n=1 Tax=Flavobacterium buctense TaxID=1648146 RepID=A0ABU9E1Z3_9FLAO|nr:T9SS type A sorting domain-containing protein [Flavobacterium buctense]
MKKLYFLLLVLLSLTANAQVITIPDLNFKAKLLSASPFNQIAKNLAGTYFKIDANNDAQIQISEALQVSYLDVNGNGCSLSSCTISSVEGLQYFTNLVTLYTFNNNPITSLPIDNMTHLKTLWCYNSSLTNLNLSNLTSLEEFFCSGNQLSSLNFTGLVNLKHVDADGNDFTSLTFSNLPLLNKLDVSYCALTFLGLNNLPSLQYLYCGNNQLTSLNLTSLPALYDLLAMNNQITTFNISNNPFMHYMFINQNPINSLFLKNGSQLTQLNITSGNLITYVCVDEDEKTWVDYYVNYLGGNDAEINSYCSFTPGGTYYTIEGNVKYDSNSNGCDSNDLVFPNLNFSITDGFQNANIIANSTGDYTIPVTAATHTVVPVLENPNYFTVSPSSISVTFPDLVSPFAQNFCVIPNGVHKDLEVILVPLNQARPGFDARYKIVYKNKGNQTHSGSVSFEFEDDRIDLVSAIPIMSNQEVNLLTWNYTNLQPFESREILTTLNINAPTETPAVNAGDQLDFVATITPIDIDEIPIDNIVSLKQIVVNSLDPNDKTCLEGTTVSTTMIGEYVHYLIRFENTGTFAAENIVVKDMIDSAKFDIATLIPLNGSHSFITRINTNQVEFIFENIDLPFDDANNDGYVAFKIKTKPTLVLGDTFSNSANIYFDYNFPIVTNTYTTTIQALSNQDFEFSTMFGLSPVPTNDLLTITAKDSVVMTSVNIYNTLGKLVQVNTNPTETIDVSGLSSGSYFIKIISDRGSATSKFIKE